MGVAQTKTRLVDTIGPPDSDGQGRAPDPYGLSFYSKPTTGVGVGAFAGLY